MSRFYNDWAPYVPVAERRRKAARTAQELARKGHVCEPVQIEGRSIAKSFWGKAWCDNLEAYGDYASGLPRGRTYVRNGSVMDLRIERGGVTALVSGSSIYKVRVGIKPLPGARWQALLKECAGQIGSLVELLQGRLSNAVMQFMTRQNQGLFPAPREIDFTCSCPDGAYMCKHIAAALYGVGARLDGKPELLFLLRDVDPADLIAKAAQADFAPAPAGAGQRLENADLASLFGIDLDEGDGTDLVPPEQAAAPVKTAPAGKKVAPGTATAKKPATEKKPATAKKPATGNSARGSATKPAAKAASAKPAKAPATRPAAPKAAVPTEKAVAARPRPDPEVPMPAVRSDVASKAPPAATKPALQAPAAAGIKPRRPQPKRGKV
ncbi:MAG: SWIM zinc finger family protein [Rhodocyclaceae bacterium]|nr:SWIM zinc finger family protein [Rhodocyclaceae bacterium]